MIKLNNNQSSVLNEVITAYLISLIILGFIGLLGQYIDKNLISWLSAFNFIIIPIIFILRNKENPLDYGWRIRSLKKNFVVLSLAVIIVLPVFSMGFHYYQNIIFGNSLHTDRFPELIKNLSSHILFQIFLIGLPEEFIYRGYMQGRLNTVFHRNYKFLGVSFGPSLFITSILFALGHFITQPNAGRLTVFFPSMLFGFIREASGKKGGVFAAGMFHGLCNVLLHVLESLYYT